MKTLKTLIVPAILIGICLGGCNKDQKIDLQPAEKPVEFKPAKARKVETPPVVQPVKPKVTIRPITDYTPQKTIIITPATTGSKIYEIQKGDTLWSIAKNHLGDGQRWKDIVTANPNLTPESMSIGQKIVLPAR